MWAVLVSWWKLAETALGKKQTRPGQKIRSGLRPRVARSLRMSELLWASFELQIHFFNQEVCKNERGAEAQAMEKASHWLVLTH